MKAEINGVMVEGSVEEIRALIGNNAVKTAFEVEDRVPRREIVPVEKCNERWTLGEVSQLKRLLREKYTNKDIALILKRSVKSIEKRIDHLRADSAGARLMSCEMATPQAELDRDVLMAVKLRQNIVPPVVPKPQPVAPQPVIYYDRLKRVLEQAGIGRMSFDGYDKVTLNPSFVKGRGKFRAQKSYTPEERAFMMSRLKADPSLKNLRETSKLLGRSVWGVRQQFMKELHKGGLPVRGLFKRKKYGSSRPDLREKMRFVSLTAQQLHKGNPNIAIGECFKFAHDKWKSAHPKSEGVGANGVVKQKRRSDYLRPDTSERTKAVITIRKRLVAQNPSLHHNDALRLAWKEWRLLKAVNKLPSEVQNK